MFTSFKVNNFRCFQSFELQELGTINLLVGAHNSGKTSLLEAIQLLCSPSAFYSLQESMILRGEYFFRKSRQPSNTLDISHLFYGHELNLDSGFLVEGTKDKTKKSLLVSIEQKSGKRPDLCFFNSEHKEEKTKYKLSPDGGILISQIGERLGTNLLRPFSLGINELTALFDEIVLTPEEILATEALQIIEPKIERIASVGPDKYGENSTSLGQKGGFMVKFADENRPITIGNLGDGIWRILAIILTTISCKDGVLLVDEIDSGLHHTAMPEMWQLIWKTAKKLNVQVFATTHSDDCWRSLADVILEEKLTGENGSNEIRIHRIEPSKNQSVVFTEPKIVIADKRNIEVR